MNTVTVTVSVAGATAAELDATSANAIAQETLQHVLRSLGSKGYTGTVSVTTT